MPISRTRAALAAGCLVLTLAACGSDASTSPVEASPRSFVLDEWSITAPSVGISAGAVEVTATNRGHETHELVIVRADDAGSLPTKDDGSVDEDAIPESRTVGEIADLAAGDTASKTLDLPAGRYVAICNIVDDMGGAMGGGMGSGTMAHVHFQLGMATAFTVT